MSYSPASRRAVGPVVVDLRSDTVTRPTPGMRQAIADVLEAGLLGDDVYGEDPTVRALEEEVASLAGHEAAVFVPSGTLGNQLALQLLVAPGEELLCDAEAHVVTYELGAAAVHSGITTRTLPGGLLDPHQVAAALRPAGFGTVVTTAVSLEQTHNRAGGRVHPLAAVQAVRAVTAAAGVALHVDGARVWNAAVASGLPVSAYVGVADTASLCLSKGLGAPAGSLLVTSADRAARARALRRRWGGSMRQAGVLAAAGRYALARHVERLADDHARARDLAAGLRDVLDVHEPETNVVVLPLPDALPDAPAVAAAAAEQGVLVGVVGPRVLRCLTHLDVDDAGVAHAVAVLRPLLAP